MWTPAGYFTRRACVFVVSADTPPTFTAVANTSSAKTRHSSASSEQRRLPSSGCYFCRRSNASAQSRARLCASATWAGVICFSIRLRVLVNGPTSALAARDTARFNHLWASTRSRGTPSPKAKAIPRLF